VTELKRSALALSSLVFGLAAASTYLLERLYERSRTAMKIDPRSILSEVHATFYWRAFLATWWGLLCAWLAYQWLIRREVNATHVRPLTIASLVFLPVAILWALYLP
jgi:hypothetical protein